MLSLFAEFIANDKPILASYKGEILFPVLVDYPEEKFGGFLAVTDYRDPFIQDEIEANGWMLWPPIRYSYRTVNNEIPEAGAGAAVVDARQGGALQPLSAGRRRPELHDRQLELARHRRPGARRAGAPHLRLPHLGAVRPGPDHRARRSSACRPARCRAISAAGSTSSSSASSRSGRRSRSLYLLLIISAVLPPGFFVLLGILLLFSWVALVGVVRAEFLRARNFEYVNAARALGVSNRTIMFRHLLPNAMVATLTFLPFILNGSITTLTSLDFLGFGLPPGSPSLGELLRQGKSNLQAPWLGITGFIVISLMLSLLIFVGEATRDAFDPRKTFK